MKDRTTLFGVIAAAFMFFGFGMIMGGGSAGLVWLSRTGSVMLGIGSIYLIARLVIANKHRGNKEDDGTSEA